MACGGVREVTALEAGLYVCHAGLEQRLIPDDRLPVQGAHHGEHALCAPQRDDAGEKSGIRRYPGGGGFAVAYVYAVKSGVVHKLIPSLSLAGFFPLPQKQHLGRCVHTLILQGGQYGHKIRHFPAPLL